MHEGVSVVFISKVNNRIIPPTFKGYEHEIDEAGKRVMRFNFPYDYRNSEAYIELYKVQDDDKRGFQYNVLKDSPIARVKLEGRNGTVLDLDDLTDLDRNATFAYRFVIDGNHYTDSGINSDGYNIVARKGTTPVVQGPAVLTMPKMHKPGTYYEKNGAISYDRQKQREAEASINTFSATAEGSLAGVHLDIPYFKKLGIKYLFLNYFHYLIYYKFPEQRYYLVFFFRLNRFLYMKWKYQKVFHV